MARPARSAGRLGFVRTLNYLAFMPLASRAPTYGRLLLELLRDERIPASRKAVLGLAVGYLAVPVDLIPERVPLLGALDDLAVVVLALDVFLDSVPPELLSEKLEELDIDEEVLERDLARMRGYVPRPIRGLARRLPDALSAAGSLARRSGVEARLSEWLTNDGRRARRARPVHPLKEASQA